LHLHHYNRFHKMILLKLNNTAKWLLTPKLFSNKVTIDINYGEEKSFWRDNRLKSDEGKIKKFNSVIDALNYIGKDGWLFVNAFPVNIGTSQVYHYGFKKMFLKSEITD
jgi:hypothetical protein